MTFDRSELIAALEAAVVNRVAEETPNSITTREFAESRGFHRAKAADILRAAVAAGAVRPQRVARVTIQGYMQRIAGYVLVDSSEVTEG